MQIHVNSFIYGDKLNMIDTNSRNQRELYSEDVGDRIYVKPGDELIFASKFAPQSWIETGIIQDFTEDNRIVFEDGLSVSPKGCCYIGKL